MLFFKMATVLIILSVVVYTYLVKFKPFVVICSILVIVVIWGVILSVKKYLQIMIKKNEVNLQEKLLSSEADAK